MASLCRLCGRRYTETDAEELCARCILHYLTCGCGHVNTFLIPNVIATGGVAVNAYCEECGPCKIDKAVKAVGLVPSNFDPFDLADSVIRKRICSD